MHKQTHKRAFYTLAGCIAALALCVAASLFLLTPAPKAQDVTIPGTRGDIYATVQLPGKLARGEELPLVVLCHGFTGSRSGDGHFAPLAEPFTAYTLSNMTDDVESAITYMQQTYGTGRTALVGHSMGGRLASLYPQRRGGSTALARWSPANGAGLRGMDDFSAVEALAAEAETGGSISTWGVDVSGALFTEMRDSDPNAALRESALPTLLTYTGHEGILSDTTQAETIAAVESLPDGRVVLEPFAEGNHNYLSEDAATAAALDKALRATTVAFLVEARRACEADRNGHLTKPFETVTG